MKARGDDLTFELLGEFGTPERPSNPIEARFWDFHREHPSIYALFDRFTREALRRRDRLGISLITERIRWETAVVSSGDEFKINNNFRAYYARLWMRNNPQFGRAFETRRLLAGRESEALRLRPHGQERAAG
jgi:hypothetical protein